MTFQRRHMFTVIVLAILMCVLWGGWIGAAPQEAKVTGVIGTEVSVNGVAATLSRSQVLPVGTAVATSAGTKVFLSQEWDTKQGRCIHWTIINGGLHRVARLGPACEVREKDLSLTTAADRAGVTVIADLHSAQAARPQTAHNRGVVAESKAVTVLPLNARLNKEVDALLREQSRKVPLEAAAPYGNVRPTPRRVRGHTGWTEVPGSTATSVANAAVVFQDRLYVLGVGMNDGGHYINTYDGATWSGWGLVPGGGTTVLADTATVYAGRLYVFAVSTADWLHYMSIFDGTKWSGWRLVPGGGTTAVSSVAVTYRDKLYLFSIGAADGRYYANAFDGSRWSGWSEIPGGGTTRLAAGAAVHNERVHLFGIGSGDHAYYMNTFDGTQWSGWLAIPGGGTTNLSPAAVSASGNLLLFGIGEHDHRYYINALDGAQWTGWRSLAGATTANPVAATEYRGDVYLFGVGEADRRHYMSVLILK